MTPRRPRLATRARLLAASLAQTANDQGAALRRALRSTATGRHDGAPFEEIAPT